MDADRNKNACPSALEACYLGQNLCIGPFFVVAVKARIAALIRPKNSDAAFLPETQNYPGGSPSVLFHAGPFCGQI